MMFLNVLLMQNPEAYIGNVHNLFDDKGNLVAETEKFLTNFMASFENGLTSFKHANKSKLFHRQNDLRNTVKIENT